MRVRARGSQGAALCYSISRVHNALILCPCIARFTQPCHNFIGCYLPIWQLFSATLAPFLCLIARK